MSCRRDASDVDVLKPTLLLVAMVDVSQVCRSRQGGIQQRAAKTVAVEGQDA